VRQWYFNKKLVEAVDSLNYLWIVVNYNSSFTSHCQLTTGKGLKVMNDLLCNTRKTLLSLKVLCQQFDSCVGSVLSYGAEVWGFTKCQSIAGVYGEQ
jgi:hypothetical protein